MDIKVTATTRQDVTKKKTYSKTAVLFENNSKRVCMVPEDMAAGLEKKHAGRIIRKTEKGYIEKFKMAVGVDDNIKTKNFGQKAGKAIHVIDDSRVDAGNLVLKEKAAVEEAKKAEKRGQ